jgi:uncharacterized protein YeaO (DUF488 family)
MIQVKRVYDPAENLDGERFLVDHLWPRGIKKEAVKNWLREVAPSDELRKRFGHDPERWEEFQRLYFAELDKEPEAWEPLLRASKEDNITLLYAARDTEHNNAVVLKNYLEKKAKPHRRKRTLVAA